MHKNDHQSEYAWSGKESSGGLSPKERLNYIRDDDSWAKGSKNREGSKQTIARGP